MKRDRANAIIAYLTEYIKNSLAEIADGLEEGNGSRDFLTGEAYAYLECLEIILFSSGESAEALLDLEKRFGADN